jgi:nucleoside-diphosphate-sugar epimerase
MHSVLVTGGAGFIGANIAIVLQKGSVSRGSHMILSVLIPAHNEADSIDETLRAVAGAQEPPVLLRVTVPGSGMAVENTAEGPSRSWRGG